jgi:SRSO17 transposase
VSLTLASREVPVMIGLKLFLPESWTSNAARMDRAKVPDDARAYRTKPEIALAEIDRVRESGVRFGGVLADAGYGLSGPFRKALTERGLTWAVGIPHPQKVYPADMALIFPVPGRGRPRKNHVPDVPSRPAQAMLDGAKWQTVSWRRGTKGKLAARFAAMRVRVADGSPQRIGDLGQQHLPGEEVWLVGEHRSNGERKHYLSNLPADTPLKKLAGAIKARWVCEQAHQQLREELGLNHFEGRSWQGLHRHALMTMIAFAFLQARRLKAAGRKKNANPTAATKPADERAPRPASSSPSRPQSGGIEDRRTKDMATIGSFKKTGHDYTGQIVNGE